jgi:hypothetical protein
MRTHATGKGSRQNGDRKVLAGREGEGQFPDVQMMSVVGRGSGEWMKGANGGCSDAM